MYDVLLHGGMVVDAGQGLEGPADVAIIGDRIAAVGPELSNNARQALDVAGLIVTPGLIDLHAHVYWGVSCLGIEADRYCLARGVTTAVDAGSAGADTFSGLRRWVIEASKTRLLAFLNISSIGIISSVVGESENLRYLDQEAAVRVASENTGVIVGIKVRVDRAFVGSNGLEPLRRARKAADHLGLPLMVHIGDSPSPLAEVFEFLRPGDIVTHAYHGRTHGILDQEGRVLDTVWEAAQRGVHFDLGHGQGSFAFRVAEKAVAQGFLPDTLGSDLHRYNVEGPVYDLPTVLSKFLMMGLPLIEVVARATLHPARLLGLDSCLGALQPGYVADVSLFELAEGEFVFYDAEGAERVGGKRLLPWGVVAGGKVCYLHGEPLLVT